jgi:hypothetical protein
VALVPAGATLLEKLHEELQQQGIQLGLCNPGVFGSLPLHDRVVAWCGWLELPAVLYGSVLLQVVLPWLSGCQHQHMCAHTALDATTCNSLLLQRATACSSHILIHSPNGLHMQCLSTLPLRIPQRAL